MQERLEKLHAYMESRKLDALIITHPKNVYYFTGFLTEPHERFMGLVLVRGESPFLFVPLLDGEKAALPHGDPGDRVIQAGEV
ncbi:aminopeptidase P family N-terminal domain-containing protein [Brevibacillus brevis]|uniref:aminopeptidase P family N-terminal domain-containing protein n=1 Tax=Brevibacillus brevis TaxID=1393 RepID=UPI0025A54C3C|nr:aminopeptidase P family N-terminal domain-containing protein [Brevibacillus brevis]WJQ83810.1 aminopeptidase P family N-terminal domain-containing protein [Brevibacillus brevis]